MHISASARVSQQTLAEVLICGGQKRLPPWRKGPPQTLSQARLRDVGPLFCPLDHGGWGKGTDSFPSVPQRGGRKSGRCHGGVLLSSLSSRKGVDVPGSDVLSTREARHAQGTRRPFVHDVEEGQRVNRGPGASALECCRSSRRGVRARVLPQCAALQHPGEHKQKRNALCRVCSSQRPFCDDSVNALREVLYSPNENAEPEGTASHPTARYLR